MSEQVPDGWSVYSLRELGQVVGGGTPSSETESYWGGSVMWTTPSEITKLKTRYISSTSRTITEEGLKNSSAKLHPKGTLLLTSRASIGYPAINVVPMATNQGFQSLRPNEKLDIEYAYQLLLNNRDGLEKLSAGSTFLEISSQEVSKFKLLIPPLDEQKKIASILTSVDEVIENIQKQIDKLRDLKKATMNDLLSKGIGHTDFKDSELGRIPKSWEVKSIGELFEVRGRIGWKGYTVNDLRNDGPLVLGGTHINKNHKIDLSKPVHLSEEKYLESPEIMIQNQDLILVKTGNTIGKLAKIEGNIGKATVNPNTVILRTKSEIQDFVYQILTSKKYQEKFWDFVAIGAQPSLNQHNIKSIMIPLPPKFERDKINKILIVLDQIIDEKNQKMSQTQSLKKSLMQDLLTGKVRIQVN